MRKKFEQLVTGLCRLKDLGDPTPYLGGAPINVNGTMCMLIYNEDADPGRFFLYVVFGYPPRGKEAAAFAALLRQNHVAFEGRGPGFCLSATTGKVGHVISIQIDETCPDQLASSMVYYASKAADWRATFFLEKRTVRPRRLRVIKGMSD